MEGNKETGIIIEDNATKEKYVWVPNQEVDMEQYNELVLDTNLGLNVNESAENIQKYDGFYVAIVENETEEINLDTFKNMSEEEYNRLKYINSSRTNSAETHMITA